MIKIIEKGRFCAKIDDSNLEDVEGCITMRPFETCESLMESDGKELANEYASLCRMVTEYVNYFYELREGELDYAV